MHHLNGTGCRRGAPPGEGTHPLSKGPPYKLEDRVGTLVWQEQLVEEVSLLFLVVREAPLVPKGEDAGRPRLTCPCQATALKPRGHPSPPATLLPIQFQTGLTSSRSASVPRAVFPLSASNVRQPGLPECQLPGRRVGGQRQ